VGTLLLCASLKGYICGLKINPLSSAGEKPLETASKWIRAHRAKASSPVGIRTQVISHAVQAMSLAKWPQSPLMLTDRKISVLCAVELMLTFIKDF
jgi:hypothetical protein